MGWVRNTSREFDSASNYPTIISVCIYDHFHECCRFTPDLRKCVLVEAHKHWWLDHHRFSCESRTCLLPLASWHNFFQVCSITYNGLCLGHEIPHQRMSLVLVDADPAIHQNQNGDLSSYRLETIWKSQSILCCAFYWDSSAQLQLKERARSILQVGLSTWSES